MFDVREQFSVPKKQLVDWYSKSIHDRNMLNNQAIDLKIISWDELLDNIPNRKIIPFHDKTHIVFFHVPKTAGTTLDFIISKNLAVWGIFKQHSEDFDKNVAAFYKSGQSPKTVMGHNELNDYFYQLLSRERLIHITNIREPVARVVSYYDFLRAQPSHPSHKLASKLSLKDFIKSPKSDEVHNAQAYRLLGLLKKKAYKSDKRSIEQLADDAYNQLANRFTIFGVTEQFDAFLIMLKKAMKWNDIYYQRKNVTKKRLKTDIEDLDSETLGVIAENNQVDILLYEKAKICFAQRCEQMGISESLTEQFKQRNTAFQSLVQKNIDM